MFNPFSSTLRFYSFLFSLIFIIPTFSQAQKVAERSSREQYEVLKNSKDVNFLVKQLLESQRYFAKRLEFYRQKPLDVCFSASSYGRFFPNSKSFLLASEDKFRKISVDYPGVMKDLLLDVKKFDEKYLDKVTMELINSISSKQDHFKNRFKYLDKELQIRLSRIARGIPNQSFYDFSDFLNCDRSKITELCLIQKREMIDFQKSISQTIFK